MALCQGRSWCQLKEAILASSLIIITSGKPPLRGQAMDSAPNPDLTWVNRLFIYVLILMVAMSTV